MIILSIKDNNYILIIKKNKKMSDEKSMNLIDKLLKKVKFVHPVYNNTFIKLFKQNRCMLLFCNKDRHGSPIPTNEKGEFLVLSQQLQDFLGDHKNADSKFVIPKTCCMPGCRNTPRQKPRGRIYYKTYIFYLGDKRFKSKMSYMCGPCYEAWRQATQ